MTQPTITIDASHTYGSGKNTGIERVVRNLCRELPDALAQRGLQPPKITTHFQGHFLQIDSDLLQRLQLLADWEKNTSEFVPQWLQTVPNWIARTSGSAKIRKWLEPSPSHLGIYKVPHHLTRWNSLARSTRQGNSIAPAPNQILILPDAYWTRRDIWKTVQTHRNAGSLIATVVYDLIPLTHPQYVGKKRSEKFQSYLDQVIRHSDTIVAISKTVRDEVQAYIEKQPNRSELCQDVRSFVLGAELTIPKSGSLQNHTVRPLVGSLFETSNKQTPYLMVASFDPRKNHEQALNAFDVLWRSNPNLQLCFAGRSGSLCDDLMKRIQNHPKLNRGLWVFHDLSDIELHYAYQHCSGVLLPSIVEGFGLPIVESLWHGRKTFASDTPIHREVGGKHCEYFQLHDAQSLVIAIQAWESAQNTATPHLATNSTPQRFMPTTWRQSASQLLDAVLDTYNTRSASPARRAA
ncbi:MAG: glycosyltransferase family 1 protein [Planctomycetota bacterium]